VGTKCKCEAPTLKLNLKRHTSSTRLLSARLRSRLCRVILVAPDLRVRSLGQFVPRLMKALKGHDMPAQGSALGIGLKNGLALKGRDIVLGRGVCLPDDGTGIQPSFMFASVSQGFTLGWDGARRWRFFCMRVAVASEYRLQGLVIYSPRGLIRNSGTQEGCKNAWFPQTNS
jgi:hypothetical protein